MPPRFAYWTILIDNTPTAFRARDREELLPTVTQLKRTNPHVELKWFAQGKLWESPEAQHAAWQKPPAPAGRDRDWRPGGEHKDPRARFDKEAQRRKKREQRAQWNASRPPRRFDEPGGAPPRPDWKNRPPREDWKTRPPREDWKNRPPREDWKNRPPEGAWKPKPGFAGAARKPWSGKPHSDRQWTDRPPRNQQARGSQWTPPPPREGDTNGPPPGGPGWRGKPQRPRDERKPWGDKPRGAKPWGGKPAGNKSWGSPPSGRKPWSGKPPSGKPWSAKPTGAKPWSGKPAGRKPWSGKPTGDRPWTGKPTGGKPWSGKPTGGKPTGGKPWSGERRGDRGAPDPAPGDRARETGAPQARKRRDDEPPESQ